MLLDRLGAQLEIKSVEQRLITGFAAAGGLDRVGDVIDMSVAFRKTLTQKRPSDVAVFVGHDMSSLPVGIPVEIEATPDGLKTVTRVFDGPAGDNLLAVAKGLQAAGQCLGMSIGYHVTDSRPDRLDGKSVRVLTGVDLIEFSYAARQAIANPRALVTGIKAPGTGDVMYTVKQVGDRWHVMKDDRSLADFASESEATSKVEALKADDTGKTIHPNTLPDSAFLYVQTGGVLDDEGKTVPRTLRHFRIRGVDGSLDCQALSDVLREIPQAKSIGLDAADLTRLQTRMRRLVEAIDRGEKLADEPAEWKAGATVDLLTVTYRLLDISERIVTEHKAMGVIGESTRNGWRMRSEMSAELKSASDDLARITGHIALVAEGKDEEALADWWRAQFELIGVAS